MNIKSDVTIIGAGLTGLSLAYFLKKAGKSVTIIEKNKHIGGVIQTFEKEGFTYETGPNTGVLSHGETVELFEDLKEDCSLEIANPQANNRWIWKKNKWNNLPANPHTFLSSTLFTAKDKWNICLEPFRKKGTNPEETLADMVRRRLGESFLDYAVDPFISGIYAGDPEKLVTKYALPKLYNLEQKYGSFIGGSHKKAKEPKTETEKKATRKVFSVEGGLGQLINALCNKIGEENIFTHSETTIKKENDNYISHVSTDSETVIIESKHVVSTIGGYALPKILPFLNEIQLQDITNVNYAPVTQVIVAYNNWNGKKLDAFGGLIPTKENKNVLGILLTGSLFKNRKPEDGALLSVYLGGIKKPDLIHLSDEEITTLVLNEVKDLLNSSDTPEFVKIFRHEKAIPQYEASSKQRFEAIDKIQKENPGLILAGNIRNGIGMSDRIKQAKDISEKILKS